MIQLDFNCRDIFWNLETTVESAESIGLTQKYIELFAPKGMIKVWHR